MKAGAPAVTVARGAGDVEAWPETVRGRLSDYYTRYYRDTLGVPGWQDLVAVRLAEEALEARYLSRLEWALGRSVANLRLLNVG